MRKFYYVAIIFAFFLIVASCSDILDIPANKVISENSETPDAKLEGEWKYINEGVFNEANQVYETYDYATLTFRDNKLRYYYSQSKNGIEDSSSLNNYEWKKNQGNYFYRKWIDEEIDEETAKNDEKWQWKSVNIEYIDEDKIKVAFDGEEKREYVNQE